MNLQKGKRIFLKSKNSKLEKEVEVILNVALNKLVLKIAE